MNGDIQIPTGPLFRMARVNQITFVWPSKEETIVIGAMLHAQAADSLIPAARVRATVLEILAGLPASKARRVALAHPDAVDALIQRAFKNMRSEMKSNDPRLNERLPAILAGEAR